MFPIVTMHPPLGEGFKPVIKKAAPQRLETPIGIVEVRADGWVDLPLPCEVIVHNPYFVGASIDARISCRLPVVKLFQLGRGHEAVVTFPGSEGRLIVSWES